MSYIDFESRDVEDSKGWCLFRHVAEKFLVILVPSKGVKCFIVIQVVMANQLLFVPLFGGNGNDQSLNVQSIYA